MLCHKNKVHNLKLLSGAGGPYLSPHFLVDDRPWPPAGQDIHHIPDRAPLQFPDRLLGVKTDMGRKDDVPHPQQWIFGIGQVF